VPLQHFFVKRHFNLRIYNNNNNNNNNNNFAIKYESYIVTFLVSLQRVTCNIIACNKFTSCHSTRVLVLSYCFFLPTLNCSRYKSTTFSGRQDLPCSPDDEDCDEFSGDREPSTSRHQITAVVSHPGRSSGRPWRASRPTTLESTTTWTSSTTKSKTTTVWRPWTTASAVTYDPRYPDYSQPTSPELDRVLPRPSVYPHDVGATRLDELDQLKLNVALIIGVAICFSLLLLTLVLVVYRYRTAGVVVGGRRARSAGDKAAAAYVYETCNMLPPPTPVAVDPGRPLIVVNRAQSGHTGVVSRPPVTDATATIPRRDVKEWFV